MNEPTFTARPPESTGRFVVTFKEGAKSEAMSAIKNLGGINKSDMMSSADFDSDAVDVAQVPSNGGVYFEELGIAVLNAEPAVAGAFAADASGDSAILAVEPEGIMYALSELEALSVEYLRGFRDAADTIFQKSQSPASMAVNAAVAAAFADTAALTWGLQATKVNLSKFSGKGRRVAILDTGLDLKHPDFAGRSITGKSFIPGVATVQDGHGHGTHCTGTACGGAKPAGSRRYGVAFGSEIFIGKVLSDQGSGNDMGILAGIDWAVRNKCHVISMSLGADVPTSTTAYETAGQRALNAGSLIVAAAANNAKRNQGNFGFVGRPANSRTFMAVAALDSQLKIANFSPRDTALQPGTRVDIAAPGVAIFSSWPLPQRNNTISGTSMATPHVAGIAALWSQKTGAIGAALWQQLIVNAQSLPLLPVDVGSGLVIAP
jgi:subtilisin family serine protease